MSKNLSKAVEPFVTSVVVGKDVVPRLSVVNIGRLIDQMVRPVPAHASLNPKPLNPQPYCEARTCCARLLDSNRLIDQMVRPVLSHASLNPKESNHKPYCISRCLRSNNLLHWAA